MNKIKSLFKASPIAMVVVSLVIAGVASAAIVSYVSNAPTAAVTVSAPVAMGIYEGIKDPSKTGATSLILTTFGGSSMSFTTTATNQANNRIGGYYVTVIDAGSGDKMTGQEFTSVMFNKNKTGYVDKDITNELCVVKADGTLTPLSTLTGWVANKKLIIFYDSDGLSTQVNSLGVPESTGMCSALTPYIGNETRSFSHLDASETETWSFTPTWNVGTTGSFTISAQYVNDLAKYAAEQYGP